MTSQRKELSAEDRAAAARLRKFWNERKTSLGITQYSFADKHGISQSSVNQYLRGYKPLNIKYCLIFGSELGVPPKEIYPELFEGLSICMTSKDEEFFELYNSCTSEQKAALKQMLKVMLIDSKS